MRDPHVEALRYRLEVDETISFQNPQPVEYETSIYKLRLDKDILTAKLKVHFSSVGEARKAVEKDLRAWEIDYALCHGRREISFVYKDADVIDRDPLPPGSPVFVHGSLHILTSSTAIAIPHVIHHEYPEPPKLFRISPDVEDLWNRYEEYLNGHEPITSMAYACWTFIETKAGGEEKVAKMYRISNKVLKKFRKLVNTKGDAKTVRKFVQNTTLIPFSSAEIKWLEATIKVIIRRVGEVNSTSSLPIVTLNDLPRLKATARKKL